MINPTIYYDIRINLRNMLEIYNKFHGNINTTTKLTKQNNIIIQMQLFHMPFLDSFFSTRTNKI